MKLKNKNLKITLRLFLWTTYFISGYNLYFRDSDMPFNLIVFSKTIYPLSIFWLHIRMNNRENWLPITPTMSTSQLWFRILPVLASALTFVFTILNLLIFSIK